jgi:hypothetical protein|tara:strand:- start:492 stop:848 length:357 start_codon:yes stop_codon:yes gene_type:complete
MEVKKVKSTVAILSSVALVFILSASKYQTSLEDQVKVLSDEIAQLKIDIDNKDLDVIKVLELKIQQEFRKVVGSEDLKNDLTSFKRMQRRFIADLDQRLSTVEKDVADLNERVPSRRR